MSGAAGVHTKLEQRVSCRRGVHLGTPPPFTVEEGELIAMSVHMHVGGIRILEN